MVDILHRVAVSGRSPKAVYDALTTIEGLVGWWTEDTSGSTDIGDAIKFRFPPGGFDMRVDEAVPHENVIWTVVDGPPEWIDTTVEWTLRQDRGDDDMPDMTIVLFAHRGWAEPVEFMHHCSTKWATFLVSLKALIETGQGAPSPNDVTIAFPD